jgi:hypothetical protein
MWGQTPVSALWGERPQGVALQMFAKLNHYPEGLCIAVSKFFVVIHNHSRDAIADSLAAQDILGG